MKRIKKHSTLILFGAAATLGLSRWLGHIDLVTSGLLLSLAVAIKFLIDGCGESATYRELFTARWRSALRGFRELLKLEVAVHLALLGKPFRPEPQPQEREQTFTIGRAGDYQLVFILLCLALVVEAPFVHLIVHHQVSPPYAFYTHGALALLTVYSIVWLVADHRAVTKSVYRLGRDALDLQIGWRMDAWIPLSAIRSMDPMNESLRAFRTRRSASRKDVSLVSPLDAPNLMVEIDEYRIGDVKQSLLGVERQPTRFVAIYVDNPQRICRHFETLRNLA